MMRILVPNHILVPMPITAQLGIVLLSTALLVTVLPDTAHAQSAAGGTLDSAIENMKKIVDGTAGRIETIVKTTLLSLLVIDFVLRAGRALIGNEGLESLLKGWAFQLGFIGFLWFVAQSVPYLVTWLGDTAGDISQKAGGANVSAGDIVTKGLAQAIKWLDSVALTSPGTYFYIFSSIISIVVLAIAVAMFVVIYMEFYLVGLAGMIALAFGGLTETRDIALGYIKALIGKGFKLMGLLIILGVTDRITTSVADAGSGFEAAAGTILLQIVGAVLIMTLPAALESLAGGARIGTGAAEAAGKMTGKVVGGAANVAGGAVAGGAAGAVVGGVGGAVGGAAATVKGGAAAGKVLSGAAKGASRGAASKGVNWASVAAKGNTMSTMSSYVGNKLAGGGKGGGTSGSS